MHKFGKARARATQSQSLRNVVEELGGQMFPFLSPGWTTLRHSTWLLTLFIYLAASGLSCRTRDPHCTMWNLSLPQEDSLGVSRGLQSRQDVGLVALWHKGF